MLKIGMTTGLASRFARGVACTLMILSLGVIAKPAQASQLNLELQPVPSLMSDFVNVNYDASSQRLTVQGLVEQLGDSADQTTPVINGSFEISATVSSTGAFSSGTITIRGAVPSQGIAQGVLLSGDLNSLGYGEAGGVVEFLFNTNGGSLADNFGPIAGVILGQCGFSGDFTQNFGSNSIAVASIGK